MGTDWWQDDYIVLLHWETRPSTPLVWICRISNVQPSAKEACALPIRSPSLVQLNRTGFDLWLSGREKIRKNAACQLSDARCYEERTKRSWLIVRIIWLSAVSLCWWHCLSARQHYKVPTSACCQTSASSSSLSIDLQQEAAHLYSVFK